MSISEASMDGRSFALDETGLQDFVGPTFCRGPTCLHLQKRLGEPHPLREKKEKEEGKGLGV